MQTAKGTQCNATHNRNGKCGMGMWDVYEWDGRRYTVCAHPIRHSADGDYCGEIIDVTDLPQVVICCGGNHPDAE